VQPLPDFHQKPLPEILRHHHSIHRPSRPTPSFPRRRESRNSPQRGMDESSTNSGQGNFTVNTPWKLAWVPACAGTTRWGVENLAVVCSRCQAFTKQDATAEIHHHNSTPSPSRPTSSFPRRRESRNSPQHGLASVIVRRRTAATPDSPSARGGNLPGSPPARGRRGREWKTWRRRAAVAWLSPSKMPLPRYITTTIQHPARRTPLRHSRAGGNPETHHGVVRMNPQQTAAKAMSPSTRRRNLPGSSLTQEQRFSPVSPAFPMLI